MTRPGSWEAERVRWKALQGIGQRREEPPAAAPGPATVPEGSATGEEPSRDGAVWVEKGAVHARNPVGLGRWPVAQVPASAPFQLWVNGVARSGAVVLQAEDELRVEMRTQEIAGGIDIDVAPAGDLAWATVRRPRRLSGVLQDIPARQRGELPVAPTEEVLPHGRTAADVAAALTVAGVRVPPIAEGMREALLNPDTRVLVARAQPPRPGRPARAWTITHQELDAPPTEELRRVAPQPPAIEVEVGAALARLRPGEPAQPGTSVTGTPLPPPRVWTPRLVAGTGTLRSADGTALIATRAGHPSCEVGWEEIVAAVRAELRDPGHVEEQDVDFDGDVWVGGHVQPHRALVATGNIEVQGSVVRARVQAGAAMRVHSGVVAALVLSGGGGLTYVRVLGLCERLAAQLEGREATPLAALLFRLHEEFGRSEARLDPEVTALAQLVAHWLPRAGADSPGPAALAADEEDVLQAAIARMRLTLRHPGRCLLRRAEQTRIEATGDVYLEDGLNTTVTTLGSVTVVGGFRGGSIWALRGATCMSLGMSVDVPTRIQIGPQGVLRAEEVRPGTSVWCGDRLLREFASAARGVEVAPG